MGNDPVGRVDPTGEFIHALIGGAAGAAASAMGQGLTKGWSNIDAGEVGIAAGFGALTGGALAAAGLFGAAGISSASSAAQHVATEVYNG